MKREEMDEEKAMPSGADVYPSPATAEVYLRYL